MSENSEKRSSSIEKRLLIIHALTSLHPGSGTALGIVDLPIQRERHTDWPIIPGSALKGIIRDACRKKAKDNDKKTLLIVFGPESVQEASSDNSYAGAVSFTDARILAFPVRSLKGVFAWITCPALLKRLKRDLSLCGLQNGINTIPSVKQNEAWVIDESPLLLDDNSIVLEEFDFKKTGTLDGIVEWYSKIPSIDDSLQDEIKKRLVLLNDDDFKHFVKHATEVVARIGLDYERKTVKKGALFYEEFLPPETIFYSLVTAEEARQKGNEKMSAKDVLAYITHYTPEVLQIGADETIGKGLCSVKFMDGKEA